MLILIWLQKMPRWKHWEEVNTEWHNHSSILTSSFINFASCYQNNVSGSIILQSFACCVQWNNSCTMCKIKCFTQMPLKMLHHFAYFWINEPTFCLIYLTPKVDHSPHSHLEIGRGLVWLDRSDQRLTLCH